MKQIVQDQIWQDRLTVANSYYKEWEGLFKVDILDKYYEGFQWKSQLELNYNPYVINKVFETIQIKLSEFVPTFPKFLVMSKPGNESDMEAAMGSANLKQDLLNTVIDEPELNFSEEMEQAAKESYLRFGIIEVGYEADWVSNPNAGKPLLGKDVDPTVSGKKAYRMIEEPPEVPQNERIYVKHIPAKTFRIGGMDHSYLNRCGWCGYYEFVHKDDLLAIPNLMNRDKILAAAGALPDPDRETVSHNTNKYKQNGLKIWKIWDLRSGYQVLLMDDPVLTLWQRKFKRLPLFDIRPDRRLVTNGFYPIPPAYHWLSSQDEYNETREMLRAHRRRFVRKFQVLEGAIDDEELEKFETGPDGALIKIKRENAITPVENADLGQALTEAIETSADDLNRISGTSDESRGVADRTTATQANIVNQRTALRETKERDRFVKWYCSIGREILLTIGEKFTGKIIVKLTSPEGERFGADAKANFTRWKWIRSEDLKDGYDFRIDVDLTSMSVTAQQSEKQALLEFTAFLVQNPMVMFSPYLVRESAYRIGYRNEKAIAEFQQMALLMELSRMQQLKMQLQPPQGQPGVPQNGNGPQQILAGQTPPAMEQIRNNMQNQMGITGG